MKPALQTIFHDDEKGKGNCFQACVASLLELPLEGVPHFMDMEGDWWTHLVQWLKPRGMFCVEIKTKEPKAVAVVSDGTWCILSGPSPRGDFLHSVIGRWEESSGSFILVHDPHPSQAFFREGTLPEWAMFIGTAPDW